MKKTILFFALIISSLAFSQIQDVSSMAKELKCKSIGKVSPMGVFMGELSECRDNVFKFYYRDYKFTKITEIKSFSFENVDNSLDYLYKSLTKGFSEPVKDEVTLKLPNDLLTIKYEKQMGIQTVSFYHTNNAGITGVSQMFTKKQIDKIFGKTEK